MGLYSIVNIEQEKHFISMHTQFYPFTRPTLRGDKIERGVARETEAVFPCAVCFLNISRVELEKVFFLFVTMSEGRLVEEHLGSASKLSSCQSASPRQQRCLCTTRARCHRRRHKE